MPTAPVQQAFDLAFQHHQAGRLADAEALYRQILAVQPTHAESLHHLGVIALQMGQHEHAAGLIHQALALNSNIVAAHCNLGEAYRKMGRPEEAIPHYHRALALNPDLPEIHNNLGLALAAHGQLDEAIAAYRRALELRPGYAVAGTNLGMALRNRGQPEEAVAAYHRALQIQPDDFEAHANLGHALRDLGRLDEAVAAYRRALDLQPGAAGVHNSLALALAGQGRLDEAIAAHRRAHQLKPEHPAMHSNLLYLLHFHPAQNERTLAGEHQRWNRQFGAPEPRSVAPHGDRNPKRRLRIGYVSPDFRDHVVGRNLVPLFRCHDAGDFEILCYSDVTQPDRLTEIFRHHSGQWRNSAGIADEAIAEMIRRDRVDILVDLSQHMAGNRLPVFARRPAPVQISFAGYPESTGLDAIEYRISDRYLEESRLAPDIAPQTANMAAEQVVLIDSFWCYDPCGLELAVNALPALAHGHVTFGSLNTFSKINEPMLQLWGRTLARVKDSRLVLLTGPGSHRRWVEEILAREGVEARRVEFVTRRARQAYLELYHRLDIVLDPFPYHGHTTSLDALWMGVPVVSLTGPRAVSRAGLSQLSNLGRPELAAFSEEDYLRVATELAHDLPRLAALRATMRPRMEASPLMDIARFTRQIEAAYRTAWRQWCARPAGLPATANSSSPASAP